METVPHDLGTADRDDMASPAPLEINESALISPRRQKKRKTNRSTHSKRARKHTRSAKLPSIKRIAPPSGVTDADLMSMLPELDATLEKRAEENNLTPSNVKSIIKHVLRDEDVVAMLKNSMEDDMEKLVPATYEPKMTRSKLKETMQKESLMWPMSPVQKAPTQATLFGDIEFPDFDEDDEDKEYDPSEDSDAQDDDSGDEHNASVCSSIDPSFTTSAAQSDASKVEEDRLIINPSALEQQDFMEALQGLDLAVAGRTRSRAPLNEVSLQKIESAFVPPDFTLEMYEEPPEPTDSEGIEWAKFVSTLLLEPTNTSYLDQNDDDDDDPEYGVDEEEDEEMEEDEEEDLRDDKAVKIPKDEKTDLLKELLMDTLGSPNVEEEEEEDADAEEFSTDVTLKSSQGQSSSQTDKPITAPNVEEVDEGACTASPAGSELDLSDNNVDLPHRFFEPKRMTLSSYLVKDLIRVDTTLHGAINRELQCDFGKPKFRQQELLQLEDQMRKHVQLLTQTVVMAAGKPGLQSYYSETAKYMLNDLGLKVNATPDPTRSYCNSYNLSLALDMVNDVGLMASIGQGAQATLEDSELSSKQKEILSSSKVIVYPSLLPQTTFFLTSEKKRRIFLPCEDNLIVIGLMKQATYQEISRKLVPAHSAETLINRVKNVCTKESKSVIRLFRVDKLRPSFVYMIRPFNSNCVVRPLDAPTCEQPKWLQEMSKKQKVITPKPSDLERSVSSKVSCPPNTTILVSSPQRTPVILMDFLAELSKGVATSLILPSTPDCSSPNSCKTPSPQKLLVAKAVVTPESPAASPSCPKVRRSRRVHLRKNPLNILSSGFRPSVFPLSPVKKLAKSLTQKAVRHSPKKKLLPATSSRDEILDKRPKLRAAMPEPGLSERFSRADTDCRLPKDSFPAHSEGVLESEKENFVEDVEEEGDDEDDFSELIHASSTIRSEQPTALKGIGARKFERRLAYLEDDVVSTDPLRDERETKFANQFLVSVKRALGEGSEEFGGFLLLLVEFGQGGLTPVELYNKVVPILEKWPSLMVSFSAFLYPEQAEKCSKQCYEVCLEFEKARKFLRKLEVYFGPNSIKFHRIIKYLASWDRKMSNADMFKSRVLTIIRAETNLSQEFSSFFPDEPPALRASEEYETVDLTTVDDIKSLEFDGFEEVDIPPAAALNATRKCDCSCHSSPVQNENYAKRTAHCRGCSLRVIQGRLYLHGQHGLQPASLQYHDHLGPPGCTQPTPPEDSNNNKVVELNHRNDVSRKNDLGRRKRLNTIIPTATKRKRKPYPDLDTRTDIGAELTEPENIRASDGHSEANISHDTREAEKPSKSHTRNGSCMASKKAPSLVLPRPLPLVTQQGKEKEHICTPTPGTLHASPQELACKSESCVFTDEKEGDRFKIIGNSQASDLHQSDLGEDEKTSGDQLSVPCSSSKSAGLVSDPLSSIPGPSQSSLPPVSSAWTRDEDQLILESLQDANEDSVDASFFRSIVDTMKGKTTGQVYERYKELLAIYSQVFGDESMDTTTDECHDS